MNFIKGRLFITLALVGSVLVSPTAIAQSLSDSQSSIIIQNCVQAQISLQQIRRSDTVTRINRGRAYETMVKLLTALNSRAAFNSYAVPALTEVTSDYQRDFAVFKSAYIQYESLLGSTIDIKCREQPQTFHDLLVQTRTARDQVRQQVTTLDARLNGYEQALQQLTTQIVPSGVSQ